MAILDLTFNSYAVIIDVSMDSKGQHSRPHITDDARHISVYRIAGRVGPKPHSNLLSIALELHPYACEE